MLVAKRSTNWQATPNNRAIAKVLLTMKGGATQADGDAIRTMAEPDAGELD